MSRGIMRIAAVAACAVVLAVGGAAGVAHGVLGEKERALAEAVRANDAAKVAELLKDGADMEESVGRGGSALELAVQYGDAGVVRAFADKGADFKQEFPGFRDWTALEYILLREHPSIDTVKILIEKGPDLKKTEWKWVPPVMTRAALNSPEVMHEVLKAGADARANITGWTALDYAIIYGNPGSVRALVDAGADVKARSKERRTAWHMLGVRVVPDGAQEIAQLLKDSGVEKPDALDAGGWTAMQLAAWVGSAANVRALAAAGADVNAPGRGGQSPLMNAALSSDASVVRALLELKADANASDDRGTSILYWAVSAADPSSRSRWAARADKSSKDKSQDPRDGIGIWQQIDKADPEGIVKALLDAGADPNAGAGSGWSVLALAAWLWDPIASGRDQEDDDDRRGSTGRSLAAREFYSRRNPATMVRMLIDAGAVRVLTEDGTDPLDVASRRTDSHREEVMAEVRKAKVKAGAKKEDGKDDAGDKKTRSTPRF